MIQAHGGRKPFQKKRIMILPDKEGDADRRCEFNKTVVELKAEGSTVEFGTSLSTRANDYSVVTRCFS